MVAGDQGLATFTAGVIDRLTTKDFDLGGDDVITVGNSLDVVFGGTGNDLIRGGRRNPNVTNPISGGVISVNFGSIFTGSQVTGIAGAVPAANWNNLPTGANTTFGDEATEAVYFNNGLLAAGVMIEVGRDLDQVGLASPGPLSVDVHDQISPATENEHLLEGYLFTDPMKTLGINVSGLDALATTGYDVYVYLDADDAKSVSGSSIRRISSGALSYYLDDPKGNTFAGTFVEVNATSPVTAQVGNYVVFRNVRSNTFRLRIDDHDSGLASNINNRPAILGNADC